MHKSIIVFFSLLVILLPLGNSLNISNANAIADFDKGDRKQVSVNSLKCNNINVNVNGLNLSVLPPFLGGEITAEAADANTDANSFVGNSGSEINDFRFICINNNNNTVIEGEEPIPPNPPEPPTASLTVKKQVFGCERLSGTDMICLFPNNSPEYHDCNTNPAINGTEHCQSLPESIFDIEVLDDQDNQIQEFVGSEQGTIIPNLQPGTYTVNEIKYPLGSNNQLVEEPFVEQECTSAGFPDGGSVLNSTALLFYEICFEYEDEQGNDCSTITLAAGEERTCTVKNYIFSDLDIDPDHT